MDKQLISIITPVYNSQKHIDQTIASVVNQSYQNWELLLIDDCSSDQSVKRIKKWMEKDDRIHLIQLETNSGAAVARNRGLAQAKGNFIAFIDSDDYWHPSKLINQLSFMVKNDYYFTYTNLAFVDEEGRELKSSITLPSSFNYNQLLKNTAIACSTVMINRAKIGDFQMPLVRRGQDTATWLMLMRERKIEAFGLDQVLNYYRQVPGSISSNKIKALKRTWNTYYNLEKLPLPKATYYFSWYVINAIRRRK